MVMLFKIYVYLAGDTNGTWRHATGDVKEL